MGYYMWIKKTIMKVVWTVEYVGYYAWIKKTIQIYPRLENGTLANRKQCIQEFGTRKWDTRKIKSVEITF
jgi:hypothetical protein